MKHEMSLVGIVAAVILIWMPCTAHAGGETRIIGRLNTGEPTKPAPAKPEPEFEVQESHTLRVDGRNLTIQQVLPPGPVQKEQATSLPETQPEDASDWNSRQTPSEGLVFLTALRAKGGGYNLEIGLNGNWLKAWTDMNIDCFNGFTEFIANGRRYHVLGLPVAGKMPSDEELRGREGRTRRAERGKRKPAPRYFLTEHEGDEQACRNLLRDLHDLYRVEHRALWWAYRERLRNRAKHEAELKANPPRKKDVTVRYWELSAEEIEKLRNRKTK